MVWWLPALVAALTLPVGAASPAKSWTRAAKALGLAPADLGVRPSRWPSAYALPLVEDALADPIGQTARLAALQDELANASRPALMLDLARRELGGRKTEQQAQPASCPDLPAAVRATVERLAGRLSAAQRLAQRGADTLSAADRDGAAAQLLAASVGDDLPALDARLIERLGAFRHDLLLSAGQQAASAVEEALPDLQAAAKRAPTGRWACLLPGGAVLVSGPQGGRFDAKQTAVSLLIVSLGGASHYEGATAAAGAGQVRAVIDLGGPVIESTGPAAGSGVFGVGLFYAAGPQSAEARVGDLSLGSGLFGVGVAAFSAPRSTLIGGRFSEGAAAFGAGALRVTGEGSLLEAKLAAQGFGATRGAGLLSAQADRVLLRCGLSQADPREGLAFLSLCQGVGYGPRAYAAGGLGLARVDGRQAAVDSSYFAQGAGYWHALGAFDLSGVQSRLQARRYSQGSGIHLGVGVLRVGGEAHRVRNWGVGPAYGWDQGVGLLEATGRGHSFYADWSAGRAEFGGRSLVCASGKSLSLRMPGLASANFRRGQPAYALAAVSGAGARVWSPGLSRSAPGPFEETVSPWGLLRAGPGVTLTSAWPEEQAVWPVPDRKAAATRDEAQLARLERPAPPSDSIGRALFLASHFAFAPEAEGRGSKELLSLTAQRAPALLENFTTEAFDEALWARLAYAGLGPEAAAPLRQELSKARGLRRALLAGLLRFRPAGEAVDAAVALMADDDWRVRKSAVDALGWVLGRQAGEEPGRLSAVRAAEAALTGGDADTLASALGVKRAGDLLALLSLGGAEAGADRLALVNACANPFDTAAPAGPRLFAALLTRDATRHLASLQAEWEAAAARIEAARRALLKATADPEPEVAAAALIALGAIGDPDEALRLSQALGDKRPLVWQAAAFGLGELGEAGRSSILEALDSDAPELRRRAALAAAQSSDADTVLLLHQALEDAKLPARLGAIAALSAAQATMTAHQREFVPELRAVASGDPEPSSRASAAALAGQLEPLPQQIEGAQAARLK